MRHGEWRVSGNVMVALIRWKLPELATLVAETGALYLLWRLLSSRSAQSDVATAGYYTLSTVAQATAALAGFLLAFVALRLPGIGAGLETALRVREASKSVLEKALADVMLVRAYATEEATILQRTIRALAVSGITVAASFLGLAAMPGLSGDEQVRLVLCVAVLALASLHFQVMAVAPSLRKMLKESQEKAQSLRDTTKTGA
jgi:hypothetical protein